MVALANWALMPKYCPNGHTFQPRGHQGDSPRVIGLGLLQSYFIGSPRDTEYGILFRDDYCRDDRRLILRDESPKIISNRRLGVFKDFNFISIGRK